MKRNSIIVLLIFLLFTIGSSKDRDTEAIKYVTGSDVFAFVSKINELGKSGYKLKSVVNVSEKYAMNIQYAGLVEFVGNDKIFEYKSQYANGVSTIVKILTSNQNDGFSVVDSVPIFENGNVGFCISDALLCKAEVDSKIVSGNMLFFERVNQTRTIPTYEFVDFGDYALEELEIKVREFVLNGFAPVRLFYSHSNSNHELVFVMQRQSGTPPEVKFLDKLIGFNH